MKQISQYITAFRLSTIETQLFLFRLRRLLRKHGYSGESIEDICTFAAWIKRMEFHP